MTAGHGQLVVLGMHRSGTSGVTGLLERAGAWFGPAGIATEANAENPKGFYERRDVRAVCDELLRGAGADWWNVAGFTVDTVPGSVAERARVSWRRIVAELDQHEPWVVKEPRLCLLLPLLVADLRSPVCVHVTREPLEVAQSVAARGDTTVQGGLALWEAYTRAAFAASQGLPRILVRHEDVVTDPFTAGAAMVADLVALGVGGLHEPDRAEVASFIEGDLHRQRRDPAERGRRLNADQLALAAAIDDGSILGIADLGPVSEGGADELAALASLHEVHELREAVRDEEARTRRVAESALGALDRAEADVRTISRNKVWRVGSYLTAVRRTITPGLSRRHDGLVGVALGGIERGRREVRGRAGLVRDDDAEPRPAPPATVSGTGSTTTTSPTGSRPARLTWSRPAPRTGRPKVAVLAWDVGHNPLGRAHVLAGVLQQRFDVEIWGARFERYGSRVWAPLRDSQIPVASFAGTTFPGHLARMQAVAREIDADALWVSKPRLPSYLLGALAKEHRNRPLLLDVDDHELSFFAEDEGTDIDELRRRRPDADLALPFERAWTRAVEPLIGAADQVTVSNHVLQDRYGGLVVPHARDERVFDPSRYDRDEVRRSLGIAEETRLLLFGGTPRVHKGIVRILEALDEIGDDRYRVLLFGTRELADLQDQIGDLSRWAHAVPYQPFDELARVVGAADLSCVLQDPTHPVARYQMPAKITDALAMGVPCLVTPVPPVQPLVDAGVVRAVDPHESLAAVVADHFERPEVGAHQAARGRELFVSSLSYAAVGAVVAPVVERLLDDPPPMSRGLRRLVEVPRDIYGDDELAPDPGSEVAARTPGSGTLPVRPGEVFDVVMLWKQNDSDLYGRRQDKFVEYLERSGRVGTIVHFDNPITPEQLAFTWRRARGTATDQGRLVAEHTVRRVLHRSDTPHVVRRTYLFGGRRSVRVGVPARERHLDWIRSVLRRHEVGTGRRPFVLWTYPANPELPDLIDGLAPDLVVTDVVDDNRSWHPVGSPEHDQVDQNYDEVLARSDLVLANCAPVAESMARFAPEIHVIPNAADPPDGGPLPPRPAALRGLTGPIIGYVGNLSSRLDLDLLDELAGRHPTWQFVFAGSTHLGQDALRLDRHPNVHFVGVLPHRQAHDLLRHVDVAIVAHLDDEMTRAMNPLKVFVYASAGAPIVSTPIANLPDLGSQLLTARDADGFAAAIQVQLDRGRQPVDPERLAPHTWPQRVDAVLALIDALADSPPSGTH